MLLLRTNRLPEGDAWEYELKLDGYRAIAFKSGGRVHLRSRNDKDFAGKYPGIVKALTSLPDETVIDGEVVALDETGRPLFNALQNYGSSKAPLLYYVFDVLTIRGRDVTGEPLSSRRELLDREILPKLTEPIRASAVLDASLPNLIQAVKSQGLEGLVAKRKNSRYESGQRSGAWQKMRVNQGQEFVIGGYTKAPRVFDALMVFINCEARQGYSYSGALTELQTQYGNVFTFEYPKDIVECHLLTKVLERAQVLRHAEWRRKHVR